ncbi:MAG TPA: diaminopimelate decarboxylase, partial [Candidatus Baltobacteraceae bacterium]
MIAGSTDLLQWHDGLAPGHTRDADGALRLGGVLASELAGAYGTPLLALDYGVLDAAVAEFCEACAPHRIDIAYAGKALLLTPLARRLKSTSLELDVCSLGELATAERAGFPAARLTLHGCGKPDAELDAVAAGRVGTIVADSLEEIGRLAARASAAKPIRTILRVNTGIEAHTHEFIRTGGDNTKFGIPTRQLDEAMVALQAAPGLRFAGLHSHIGSQIYDAEAFVENVRSLVELAARFHRAGLTSEKLIVGGGFGVQTDPNGERTVPIPQTIAAIAAAVDATVRAAGIPPVRIGIEPGRALIARAGTSIYTVMARKRQQTRTFVVIDGGLADNPRPALYQAHHHVAAVAGGEANERVAVCGRSCENDFMGDADLPADLAAGDLAAMCTTGAYTYSMASNYNRFA